MEISIWFNWAVDLFMFNFRFCLAGVHKNNNKFIYRALSIKVLHNKIKYMSYFKIHEL